MDPICNIKHVFFGTYSRVAEEVFTIQMLVRCYIFPGVWFSMAALFSMLESSVIGLRCESLG